MDTEYSFDDIAVDELLSKPHIQFQETTDELIEKVAGKGRDGLWSLYLASCGVIDQDEIVMLEPELYYSRLTWDPVRIKEDSFLTQSLQILDHPEEPLETKQVTHSYMAPIKPFAPTDATGQSILDGIVSNTNLFCCPAETGTSEPGIKIDRPVCQMNVVNSCEILHDLEVSMKSLYAAAAKISTGVVNPSILPVLYDLYDYRNEEIYALLSAHKDAAAPVVLASLLESILKVSMNHYHQSLTTFLGFCYEMHRSIPHAEHLSECLTFLSTMLPPESMYIIDILHKVLIKPVALFLDASFYEEQIISVNELALVTRFVPFYRNFIRKFYPQHYYKPNPSHVDATCEWSLYAENEIINCLRSESLLPYDAEDQKYPTPRLEENLKYCLRQLIFEPISDRKIFRIHLALLDNNQVDILAETVKN